MLVLLPAWKPGSFDLRHFMSRFSRQFRKVFSQTEAARIFGVARGTVSRAGWWNGKVDGRALKASTARTRTVGFAVGTASSSHDGCASDLSSRLPGTS